MKEELLDDGFNPQLLSHRADVQQLLVVKDEVPTEQQEWNFSLDHEDPEPPHIKEEQEEFRTSQMGEQLQGLEEADTKFPFTPVTVKSEDDEEKPQSSQLHQRQTEHMETEADGEDCGGSEPARNSDPDRDLQPDTGDSDIKFPFTPFTVKSEDDEEKPQSSQLHQRQTEQMETETDGEDSGGPEPARNSDPDRNLQPDTGDSSETETDDSDDWKETTENQSGLNSLNNDKVPVGNLRCSPGDRPFSCSDCGKRYRCKGHLKRHIISHTVKKTFSCSVCEKSFTKSGNLEKHIRVHTGEKPFNCSFCKKSFKQRGHLNRHIVLHTKQKHFSCSVCGKNFIQNGALKNHAKTHTGEKPFSCSVCEISFSQKKYLEIHMRIHTGDKPFSCTVCDKKFIRKAVLEVHMITHTGENPI